MGFLRWNRRRIILIGAFSVLCMAGSPGSSSVAHIHETAASGLPGSASGTDERALPAVSAKEHIPNTKQAVRDMQKQNAASRGARPARMSQREMFWFAVSMGAVCGNAKADQ